MGARNPGCSQRQRSPCHGILETQAWVWCQLFKEARRKRAGPAWGDV